MKYRVFTLCFSFFLIASFTAFSQQTRWPKTFNTNAGTAKLYEPEPESYQGNLLKIRAAISLLREGKTDPVFGVLWADVELENAQNNNLNWQNATVTNIKFPGEANDEELDQLTQALQKEVPSWNISISKNDLTAKLENSQKEAKLSTNLNNNPPKVIYTQKPSILVLIDGQPQLSKNSDWGVEQVSNTPFTIIKNTDDQYYLYGAKRWYTASSLTGRWSVANQLPSRLNKMDEAVRASDTSKTDATSSVADIVVSTEPAELIQSNGEANFSPIQGTNLLYMSNTSNDIFLDVNSQQYYVLISGRWFKAPALTSNWTYVSSDKLPADFAKIPEGSPKDVILPNVAGTNAANESVMEAQVPQTAKVDRKNANATVTYDGDPIFDQIEGTHLKYAVNTSGTVLNLGKKYYYVENGVWFESYAAMGPWSVATSRPAEVENIPPSYPVYNAKYVYIYDVTPDYIYMGYTPGYLGNYVYGPTIVYGTGYYYKPWRGRYYYPRAMTWGFNMRYNPWTGWNFGVDFWGGWFSFGISNYYRGPVWGGWWGPPVYRPAYCRPYNYNYGYYGYGHSRNVVINNYRIINNNRSTNIYRYRRDVVTHDRHGYNYRNNGVSRPNTYNGSNNNGRYNNNNGRVMPGNNSAGGNRGQEQRAPGRTITDRPVTRTYQPNGQRENRPDNSGRQGNNGQDRNTTGSSPVARPGNFPSRDGNAPRVYTPSESRNERVYQGRANQGEQNRPTNPVTDSRTEPNRPFNNNRSVAPGAASPSFPQERRERVAENRNVNPMPEMNRPQQRERPSGGFQERSVSPQSSSGPRVERPSREGNQGGGNSGGAGNGPRSRGNRDR